MAMLNNQMVNFIKFHPMVTWESHELSLIIHSQGAHARQGLSPGA